MTYSNKINIGWHFKSFIALQPNWILKNDGDKVVLYLLSNDASYYFLFKSQAGIILSLFDGKHQIKDIINIIYIIFNCTLPVAEILIFNMINFFHDFKRNPLLVQYPVLSISDCPIKINFQPLPHEFIYKANGNSDYKGRRCNTPISLMLYFSNDCQTNCRYCYAERKKLICSQHLTYQEWQDIFKQAHSLEIHQAVLTGGDPLKSKDAVNLMELLIQYNILFSISTKCFVSSEHAHRLANAGFNNPVRTVSRWFQISIDSGNPEIADFLTRSPGHFERMKTSIKNLVNVGIIPRIKAVLTPYNITDLDKLVTVMIPFGIKLFNFSLYEESFYWHSDDLILSNDDLKHISEQVATFHSKFPEIVFEGNAMSIQISDNKPISKEEKFSKWQNRAGCSGGRSTLGIAPDGKAVICEQTPQSTPFIFGDLRTTSIIDIWNSDKLQDFIFPDREKFLNTICYICEDFINCQYSYGNCFREAYFATGNPFDAPPNCPYRDEEIPRIGLWKGSPY